MTAESGGARVRAGVGESLRAPEEGGGGDLQPPSGLFRRDCRKPSGEGRSLRAEGRCFEAYGGLALVACLLAQAEEGGNGVEEPAAA